MSHTFVKAFHQQNKIEIVFVIWNNTFNKATETVLSSSIQSGRDALSSSTSNFASVSNTPVNASHSYHEIQ